MSRKPRTFSSVMTVLLIIVAAVAMMFVLSLDWLFTQTQMDIAIITIMLFVAALFVFQGKM